MVSSHLTLRKCSSQNVKLFLSHGKQLSLTFASLGAIHVGKKDVVVVCPVEPLVGIIDSESSGAIDLCVNDNRLTSAIHANTPNERGITAVYPEHVPSKKYGTVQRAMYYSEQT